MTSSRSVLAALCCLCAVPSALFAQARYTASDAGVLQVGATGIVAQSNYLPYDTDGNAAPLSDLTRTVRSNGFGVYGNFDFRRHLGLALDFSRISGSNDTSRQTVGEAGLRYLLFHRAGFTPYVRASYGRGLYHYSEDAASLGFNLYGLAAGTDYRVSHSFNLRAEYEYQGWQGVPLRNPEPQLFKVGIAYRFHSDILGGQRYR